MVVTKDFASALAAVILLGHVNCLLGVVVRLDLAALNVLDPTIVDDLVNADAAVRIRVEHLQQNPSQGWGIDADVESLAVGVVRVGDGGVFFSLVLLVPLVPASHQLVVVEVASLGSRPNGTAKGHVNHDNGRAPHVKGSRVVRPLLEEHLGRDIGLAAAQARAAEADLAHVLTTLAAGFAKARVGAAEDLGNAKVGNLELAVLCDEQVLELDVTMGNAIGVQVVDALDELLEEAQAILKLGLAFQVALLHKAEQVALGAVFHDVVPPSVISAEANRLDNVWMMQALADAELRLDLLVIILLALPARLASELLDGVHFSGEAFAHHERDF